VYQVGINKGGLLGIVYSSRSLMP